MPNAIVRGWSHAVIATILSASVAGRADAQPLRVFLDCSPTVTCDADYFQTTIDFVAYVRDPSAAQVHVLLTAQPTGAGGLVIAGEFIGRLAFGGLIDTVKVTTMPGSTDDEQRRAIAQLLRLGLVRYVSRTDRATGLSITYAQSQLIDRPLVARHDPWHAWVFALGLTGSVTGQQYSVAAQERATISADHVSEKWRLDFQLTDNNSYNFVHVDTISATTIERSFGASGRVVRSIGGHWSAGLEASAAGSTFNNESLALHAAPAVEFDVFPYTEATRRELTLLYAIGGTEFHYYNKTIFDRLKELRYDQSLTLGLGTTETWGSMSAVLQAGAFLDNIAQNHEVLNGDFRIRLFSGFSFTVDPTLSIIHDQIYLPAGSASRDDILLARRQLATSYQYSLSLGISFTFGSVFNSVVNPRFAQADASGAPYSPP